MKHKVIKAMLAGMLWVTAQVAIAEQVVLNVGDVKGDRVSSLEASGLLKNLPYKLKIATFDSGAPVQEALNAGALDVGFTGDLPFLFVYAAGAPVKAVGAWQNNPDSIALLTKESSGIKLLKDLRGKRIAVNRGGWGHYLALGLLEKAGLTEQDVQLRFLGPVDGRMALASGSVDAWAPWEPYIATSLANDHTVRVPEGGGKGVMSGYSFALARNDALKDAGKRKAIADLLTRLAKAQVWVQQHKPQFAQVLSKQFSLPVPVTTSWINDTQIHPVVLNNLVVDGLQKQADFFYRHKVLPKPVEVKTAFDFSLAEGANEVAKKHGW